jgi:hypothetical protein
VKIAIATPVYGGLIPQYVWALVRSVQLLDAAGIAVQYLCIENCPYIDMARNRLVRDFLATDADFLLFIDADISWVPEELVAFMRHDELVVGAAAPYRVGPPGFAVQLVPDTAINTKGLIEAMQCATAFLRIHREAFAALKAAELAPEQRAAHEHTAGVSLEKFDCYFQLIPTTNGTLGEDIAFCRKWRKIGGRIWLDPRLTISHYNMSHRAGKLLDQIKIGPPVWRAAASAG